MADKSRYQQLQDEYQGYVSGTGDFKQALQDEYDKKFNSNKDLITQKNSLQAERFALPNKIRQEYMGGPIRNPLAQENIISSRYADMGQNVANVTDLLNQRRMGFQDILSDSMTQWGSQAEAARLSAEAAWREYQDQLAQEESARARAAQEALMSSIYGGGGGGDMGGEELVVETGDSALQRYGGDFAEGAGTMISGVSPSKSQWSALEKMTTSGNLKDKVTAEIARKGLTASARLREAKNWWEMGDYGNAAKSWLKSYLPW